MDVIEIIAAYLAGRHVDAADLKSINGRCLRGEQNSLNVPCNFKIVIQSLLFVGHRIDDGVVERKGRLLSDRFKNDEVSLRERCTHRAISECQDTQILLSIAKRCRHDGSTTKCAAAQLRQFRGVREFVYENRLTCLPDASD